MENVVDLFFTVIVFFYEKTKQPAHNLIDHSSRPISVRGFAQLL